MVELGYSHDFNFFMRTANYIQNAQKKTSLKQFFALLVEAGR